MMLTALAQVKTPKAGRYLKALCNHFSRKVTAEYDEHHGTVQFGFGYCELDASADELVMRIQATDDENFTRVKHVVGDHLERFSGEETLQVIWIDQP